MEWDGRWSLQCWGVWICPGQKWGNEVSKALLNSIEPDHGGHPCLLSSPFPIGWEWWPTAEGDWARKCVNGQGERGGPPGCKGRPHICSSSLCLTLAFSLEDSMDAPIVSARFLLPRLPGPAPTCLPPPPRANLSSNPVSIPY
jgi:hypothetical protein